MADDEVERPEQGDSPGYERALAFSDGVFAIAITLLVLGVAVPEVADDRLAHALSKLGPQALSYFVGFAVMGLFWLDHNRLFARLRVFDATLLKLNLGYLSLISLMPFTTGVFGRYGGVSIAVALYAANVAATSLSSVAMRVFAEHRGLVAPSRERPALWHSLLPSAIFLVSIPVAFVDAHVAPFLWLGLLATGFARRAQEQG
ncbi:MAG TPA: TMEM175 family protein [Conexibacter sp.]|nr:TMEM175 family protein [Conexibacter sp.]